MTNADYGVLNPAWAGGAAARLADDSAFVQAMLDVEAAWVRVQAGAGLCTAQQAAAVDAVARAERYDLAEVARRTPDGANALIPLLGMMRELLAQDGAPEGTGTVLHRGATSQDIIDSALMLLLARGIKVVSTHLHAAGEGLAALARTYARTPCIARSLTQHALPTTFGYRAAAWLSALGSAGRALQELSHTLSLQWGGAVGTLASLDQFIADQPGTHPDSAELVRRLAAELQLVDRQVPWHTNRVPLLQAGSALGTVIAALGTFGTDVLTASRPEIGELSEPREAGKGGSSAMPQKQNPVHSLLLRTAALSAPALVGTLFTAAGTAADERPDGAWHAEWPALRELLRLAVGSAEHADVLANGLRVNESALARNLALGGDAVLSERLATVLAPVIAGGKPAVQDLVRRSLTDQVSLRELLRLEVSHTDLSDAQLDELLDPAGYLGSAARFTDTVLADYALWKESWLSHN